jgi:hypothetical protein
MCACTHKSGKGLQIITGEKSRGRRGRDNRTAKSKDRIGSVCPIGTDIQVPLNPGVIFNGQEQVQLFLLSRTEENLR